MEQFQNLKQQLQETVRQRMDMRVNYRMHRLGKS